jgi:SAM-dependent methyltransferase
MRSEFKNLDQKTVVSFGDEWSRFDQLGMSPEDSRRVFDEYFIIFPWDRLRSNAQGFDMGCGSGRWARWVAPRVGRLNCIDPSDAINVARKNLASFQNVNFFRASVDDPHIPKNSQDFGYSLGVLHHVPDTLAAINSCAALLKPGAPLLIYLYYAFDNRPLWFKALWRISDLLRRIIHRLPASVKHLVTDAIAVSIYFPVSRLSLLAEKCGLSVHRVPLSYYRNHSLYTMRTDARDRFGTPLEQRFRKEQIESMMLEAGLVDIRFSEAAPYWCALGFKSPLLNTLTSI